MDSNGIFGCINECQLRQVGWIKDFWLLNEMYFVSLDLLTRPVKNPISLFLIKPKIILYHVLLIKYLWISKLFYVSIGLKSTEKIVQPILIPFFNIIPL